jgi:hypothetical protein
MLSTLVVFAAVTTSIGATAQEFPTQQYQVQTLHRHGQLYGHDYWHPPVHVPNVAQLDAYSDQLAKVARHLHEDAHKLSQDYEHSVAIEQYVDSVDRLQQHMHEILHEAAETGTQSWALTAHVKSDVRQVKHLIYRLTGELSHQGLDGARTEDFHAMVHMRQIISQEALPLIRQLEVELYGYTPNDHIQSFHRRPLAGRTWMTQRIPIHH